MTLRRTGFLGFVVTSVAMFAGTADVARAALYGYSIQQTSKYTFTGSSLTVGSLTASTSTSAIQKDGAVPTGIDGDTGTLDADQAYVGPGGTKPAENSWAPKGLSDADYTRGDALITAPPADFGTNNLAELYLASPLGEATAEGSWSVSASLTLTADGTISLGFDYKNELTLINSTPGGVVQGNYTYVWTITDSSGAVVYSVAHPDVNLSLSLATLGSISETDSGTLSLVSSVLKAGTYTGTISGTEKVFASSVPEPATWTLLAMGGAGLFGLRYRRSKKG